MIENLSDLKSYADALAKRVPSIAHRVNISEPGLSADDLSQLSKLSLPPIYERCISTLSLFGVAVGYFSMWPGSVKTGHMVEALLQANNDSYPGTRGAKSADLLVVAQEEANLICVGRSGSSNPDAVYLLDVMRSSAVEQYDIAPDFEKFLLLAGNLHEIGRKCSSDVRGGVAQISECCQYLNCTTDQTAFWVSKMEIMLS